MKHFRYGEYSTKNKENGFLTLHQCHISSAISTEIMDFHLQ